MKPSQQYHLFLNDTEIGILQEMEETLEREIKQQRGYRSNVVHFLHCGVESYTLCFKRLNLPESLPSDLYSLHNFTVTLMDENRTILYTGCEFSRLHLKADSAGVMVEEASICATERTVNEQ